MGSLVALGAHAIARSAQLQAVRLVAITAHHAGLVHLALHKRAVFVDFVANLAVGVVQRRLRQGQTMSVQQVRAIVVIPQRPTARVTAAAAVYLRVGLQWRGAPRNMSACRESPLPALCQGGGKAAVRRILELPLFSQRQMLFAGTVAGLAAHVQFRKFCIERAGLCLVVLLQVGAVAFGAAGVPVLVGAGPVQRVLVIDLLVRVQVIPALPALGGGARIPGDTQGLQPTAGQRQQVLLQRIYTEHIGDFEVLQLAILAVRVDHEFVTLAKEACGDAVVGKAGVVEVSQHGVGVRQLHGEVVMGAAPLRVFLGVAVLAGSGAGEGVGGAAAQQQRSEKKSWEQHVVVTVILIGGHTLPALSLYGQHPTRYLSWSASAAGADL